MSHIVFFFFFQAEDGIRDGHVTGVQTCALPIFHPQLAALDVAVAVDQARPPVTQGFHLGAGQHDAGFPRRIDVVIVACSLVRGDELLLGTSVLGGILRRLLLRRHRPLLSWSCRPSRPVPVRPTPAGAPRGAPTLQPTTACCPPGSEYALSRWRPGRPRGRVDPGASSRSRPPSLVRRSWWG